MVLKIYTWVLVIYNILYVGISVTQRNVPLTVSSTLYMITTGGGEVSIG